MRKELQKGFTLIELLVVIAIIGILSSVVLVSLNTARSKARDSQRMANAQSITTAISVFALDQGSERPPAATATNACPATAGWFNDACPDVASGDLGVEFNKYMKVIPSDTRANSYYYATGTGYTFCLGASLENAKDAGYGFLCNSSGCAASTTWASGTTWSAATCPAL